MAKFNFKSIYGLFFIACCLSFAHFSAAQAQNVAVVNAADYFKDGGSGTTSLSGIVTPDGIAAAFGAFNITAGQPVYLATPGQALPKILGGVKVSINGTDADLMVVTAGQINFVIPSNAPTGGIQTITVTNANSTTSTGLVRIESFAPGIFSGAGTGAGVAAANWIAPGSQVYQNTHQLLSNAWTHTNITVGTAASPTYLILYTTGVRKAPNTVANDPAPGLTNVAESCKVTIQGIPAKIDYAGPQQFFAGLDQLNVIIPPELSGLGVVNVRLEVKDANANITRISNSVEIKLAGNLAPVTIRKTLNIAGDTAAGELAVGDDVEADPQTGKLYYTDVYSFTTTAANTSVAIDLRTNLQVADPLDTLILLRKVNGDGTQSFFAADDQGGGFGNGKLEANNNSLLFTVLPEAGEYWIFVTSADVAELDTGPYTLTLYSNIVTPITYGQTLNGNFTTNTKIKTAANVYADAFSFTGTENDAVRIAMNSTAFDSLVILRERNGDEITLNDNGGGGLNALIATTLPIKTTLPQTRTFIIVTTPLETDRTGAYTLGLTKTSALAELQPDTNAYEFRMPSRVQENDAAAGRRQTGSSRAMYRRPVAKIQEQ